MRVHLIAAALPPALDGIGDYTALVAAELARSATVTILTAQANPEPIPGVAIETVFSASEPRSVWNLARHIKAAPPDWVLLQYNPFSYGQWGLNLHLPLVIRQIQRRHSGTKIAVMVHETFVPFGVNWKFRVMSLWQRPQFAVLSRAADVLFFSVDAWAETFARKFPGKPVIHLPVGSNIARVPISRAEARARLGIADDTLVLGVFGGMHISRLMDWVRSAADAVQATGRPLLVLHIGPDSDAVRALLGPLPLQADGPLSAEEVSRRFAAMDIHLAPFVDGISTRRGSVMTGLQHGIATVGTQAQHTDAVFREANGSALLLTKVSEPDQFIAQVLCLAGDATLRQQIGLTGQQLYEQEFAWASLARRIQDTLANPVYNIQ